MLKHLKRPHGIVLVLVVAFVLAWLVWTMVLVPRSEMPLQPGTPMNPTGNTAPANR
jgi:hypothetical protein